MVEYDYEQINKQEFIENGRKEIYKRTYKD